MTSVSTTGTGGCASPVPLVLQEGHPDPRHRCHLSKEGKWEEKRGINRSVNYPGGENIEGKEGKWLEKWIALPQLSAMIT